MGDTPSYGTGLEYGSAILDETPNWTEIEKVFSVVPPNITVDESEKKWLKSANRAVEKRPSWKRAGDMTASIDFNKDVYAALHALVGTKRAWRITYADGSKDVCDGFIKELGKPELNGDGDVAVDIVIACDLPTFQPAT